MTRTNQPEKQTSLANTSNLEPLNFNKEDQNEMQIEEEKLSSLQQIIASKSPSNNDFPSFDDFVDGLESWKEPLKNAIQSKSFQNLYNFLKIEYKTKKVNDLFMEYNKYY